MISDIIAWTIGIGAAVIAALLSTADSALLAFHASESGGQSGSAFAERERLHRALSMGRVLSYIASGAALAQAIDLESYGALPRFGWTVAISVVVCVLAEGTGRAVGYSSSSATFKRFSGLTKFVATVLSPAVALGGAIDRVLQSLIPPDKENEAERETSAEQFREVVAAEADVSSAEEELIHGVFSLGETEVHEIMAPRVDIVGIDATTPWSEVLDRVRASEHARFPVYRETLDEVIGILYAKDILPAIVTDEEPASGWISLIRAPVFIPTSKRIDEQLREFQSSRTHIAIVSDEYGGTAGLITIEDILEEIVGEIRDEYDVEEPQIQQEGTDRFWIPALVPLDDVAERLNVDFGVDDVTTVGGLVYALFDRVPKSGESLVHAGFRIVVERVRRRRVERVYFERLEPAATPDGE
jgi:CBS domain containing-hemolysin-like protein